MQRRIVNNNQKQKESVIYVLCIMNKNFKVTQKQIFMKSVKWDKVE